MSGFGSTAGGLLKEIAFSYPAELFWAKLGEYAAMDNELEDEEYQLSGQIKVALRAISWPEAFPLRDRLEMTTQALTALFEEERRKKAVDEFEEVMRRPGGLEAFEEFLRDFRNRKVELRAVFRQPR
jgi:hypothetical protein